MATPPIRALTLYKQGIGYFERRGAITASEIALSVPRSSTNDVLKSLDIVVYQGGPISSVDYETPEDKTRTLAELPVRLADRSSLVDLLTSLRGSLITLQFDGETRSDGRLIGVEASLDPAGQAPAVLLQRETAIQVVPLAQIRGLTLHDEQAARDVAFFLDVSRTEQTRTTLTIRLAEGEHDLGIRYLAPSPTWRVSYRLIAIGPNQARLLGWGLFDNTLDEDLENVSLTLISGRPVSFEYELYESRIPARPQVSDDPTSLEAMAGNPLLAESLSTISHELRTPLTSITGYATLLERGAAGTLSDQQREMLRPIRQQAERMQSLLNDLLSLVRLRDTGAEPPTLFYRAGPLGDLKVSGSYFMPVQMGNAEPAYLTYPVATSVSVRRGQSAMVPIIDAEVSFESLCVYNGAKMPNHPLLVWRLRNSTGVALEQGPVTIVDDEQYRGEGLIRFSGVGDDLHIPFALEFGILVRQETETEPRSLWQVDFDAAVRQAQVSWAYITAHRYTLDSHIGRELTVRIEHRDRTGGTYVEMPAPELTDGGHTRWPVVVPAHGEAAFTIREREIRMQVEDVASWSPEYIEELNGAGLLTDRAYGLLQQLTDTVRREALAEQQIAALRVEYQQIGARQEQFRKNLGALGASDRETQLRNRMLDDLEASEDRRRAIEAALIELEQQTRQAQTDRRVALDEIFGPEGN
jgi:signal transduction histidine kinase